jgi:hypothetical protein
VSARTASPLWALRGSEILLGVHGLLWVVLAATWAATRPTGFGGATSMMALVVVLMLGNAGILIGAAMGLRTGPPWVLRAAMFWVGINLVLSFTDEVGLLDLLVGALSAATLVVLAVLWHRRRRDS